MMFGSGDTATFTNIHVSFSMIDGIRSNSGHPFFFTGIAFDWMTFCFFAGWTASSSESSEPSLSSAGAAALDDALDLLGGAAALDDSLGLVGGAAAIDGALAVAAGGAVATLGALDPSGVALAALAVAGAGATLAALKAFGIALTALDANGGGAALAALASSLGAGCDGGEGAAWACVEGAAAACEGIPGIIMPGTIMTGIIVPPCCICVFTSSCTASPSLMSQPGQHSPLDWMLAPNQQL